MALVTLQNDITNSIIQTTKLNEQTFAIPRSTGNRSKTNAIQMEGTSCYVDDLSDDGDEVSVMEVDQQD